MKNFKYLISTILLSMALFTSPVSADFSAGLFGYNQSSDCSSGCGMNIESSEGVGWIMSATTNGDVYVGADVFGGQGKNNSFQGVDLKAGVKAGSFNFSAGAGQVNDHGAATNSPRFSSVASDSDDSTFGFVEIEHNIGVFVRYTQYDVQHNYILSKSDGSDNQNINANFTRGMVWVGYRAHF